MHLSQFLTKDFKTVTSPVIQFKSGEYPVLFFANFLKQIKMRALPLESINVTQHDFATLVARLTTTFLGSTFLYWLTACDELDAKKKEQLFDYIKKYQGPHQIWFYTDDQAPTFESVLMVEVPAAVDKKTFTLLAQFFLPPDQLPRITRFSAAVFSARESVSLDEAYMLMQYGLLVSHDHEHFFADWLPTILANEKSLFALSQWLFARQEKKFFLSWAAIRNDYSDQFWIAFWSEQLFRALHVIEYLSHKKFADAKTIAYRLPFSFMQQDYRKHSATELGNAHQFLYSLDYHLKNGGNDFGLDLFFSHFFMGSFSQLDKNKR